MADEIDAYYKFKREYTDKNGEFSAILGLPADKRAGHKCLRCRKAGGDIFTEDASTLRAECGADPKCDLNITVNRSGPVVLIPDLLRILRNRVEYVKTSLIEMKIQHALGTITDEDAVGMFDEKRELLRKLSAATASIDERMLSITDSPQKLAEVNRLKAEIYTATQEFKNNLQEFSSTGRDAFLIDALEQQTNVITPLVTELRDTLYVKNAVEYDPNSGMSVLVQDPYTLKDMEVPFIPELIELFSDAKITETYSISS
jgi:hypothetical protein